MTTLEALAAAHRRLAESGLGSSSQDAERLLLHVTGWDRAALLARPEAEVTTSQEALFLALVEERARRRPLQHLTGTQAFWRHDFRVTPDVLIPRPETEILVEAAIERLRDRDHPTVVDVGTGSGCIALSLAFEVAAATVHAIDISAPALRIARDNADRLGLSGRVVWHQGDLLAPVVGLAGDVQMIVSNPPYVDPNDIPALAPEVRDHEPALALFPPGDAYSIYRRLVPEAARILAPRAWLLLEVGQGMSDQVASLCRSASLAVDTVIPDLQSIPR
ncbi:MAG: peptide chain release factor N(5)-glutamine methyltransferase, partial [Vicinamibacteria bacterium]